MREEEIRRQEALAAEAAVREEIVRREAELALLDDAARREAEEAENRRLAELALLDEAARREAETRRLAELAQLDEAARREAELAAARDEAARREAELAAQRAAERVPVQNINVPVIMFTADSSYLRESEKAKLRELAEVLKDRSVIRLRIEGYTAHAGSVAGRNRISLERAQNVANYLVSLGVVSAANITSVGYGSERPAASNETRQGMAANRRAVIIILED
jgi:outer membrane protein OmpA-like peptidoglycan-associated protein